MKFCKMQGNGNDFIVIENLRSMYTADRLSDMAVKLCRRRQSIGADGLLVLEDSESADFTMRLFNSDGSEGEMCGNGARCIARYAFEGHLAPSSMTFNTLAGVIGASVDPPFVTLDMGRIDMSRAKWEKEVETPMGKVKFSFLKVGVPHCMILSDGLTEKPEKDLVAMGRYMRNNLDLFPDGTNVNFMEIMEAGKIRAVTYERGVEDLTDSCGTGSTACALTACRLFGLSSPVRVENPGGINEVFLDFASDGVSCRAGLKGRTVIAARGEFSEEALLPEQIGWHLWCNGNEVRPNRSCC